MGAAVLPARAGTGSRAAYLRQCLLAGLPWLASMLFLLYVFLRDPLWPEQDIEGAAAVAYQLRRHSADAGYTVAAVWSSLALLIFVLRAGLVFKASRRH